MRFFFFFIRVAVVVIVVVVAVVGVLTNPSMTIPVLIIPPAPNSIFSSSNNQRRGERARARASAPVSAPVSAEARLSPPASVRPPRSARLRRAPGSGAGVGRLIAGWKCIKVGSLFASARI